METGLSIIADVLTPEATEATVGLIQQIQEFLAQNGEIVMLMVSTLVNYMVKPRVKDSRLIPIATLAICIGVFFLLNETYTIRSLIFGGLYLWAIVTLQYLQDKKAIEIKMLEKMNLKGEGEI